MGLDGVELIMAMERTFGIDILDEEASRVGTVGDLFGLILLKTGHLPEGIRAEDVAEARVRAALSSALGIVPESISREARLDHLVPLEGRQVWWDHFRGTLEPSLPALRFARRARGAFVGGVLVSAVIGLLLATLGAGGVALREDARHTQAWGVCMIVLSGGAAVLLPRLLRGFRVCFAPDVATVADLMREVAAYQAMRSCSSLTGLKAEEAWELFVGTFAEQTGIPRERIAREALIHQDLGID